MKTSKKIKLSRELAGEVKLARIQFAKAESQLKDCKGQWRVAKRRRKEARQSARRARKQFKQAKTDLSEARLALNKAEAKLLAAGERAAKTKKSTRRSPAKRPVAKAGETGPGEEMTRLGLVPPASPGSAVVEESRQPITASDDLEAPPGINTPLAVSQTTVRPQQPQP